MLLEWQRIDLIMLSLYLYNSFCLGISTNQILRFQYIVYLENKRLQRSTSNIKAYTLKYQINGRFKIIATETFKINR